VAEPLYRQIVDDLRSKIEAGELAPGSQLKTEIELREQYDASRNTVRDAIKWLTTLGLVETRPGQGTFVVEKINPFVTTLTGDPETGRGGGEEGVYKSEVAASHRVSDISDPRVEIQKAIRPVARSLRIEEGAPVVCRHQERYIDGTPWSLQTSFYPMTLVLEKHADKLIQATDIPDGVVAYLADECGIQQAGYRDTISVRAPNENEARVFKLPADGRVSVFEIYRVAFDKDLNRIRLTITVYPSDRNRLRIDVGRVPPRPLRAVPGTAGDEEAPQEAAEGKTG
jgi:GntR family transcriptional regulator